MVILDKDKIELRLQRMALEIAERNYRVNELTVLGISGSGHKVAAQLAQTLKDVGGFTVSTAELQIDKQQPQKIQAFPEGTFDGKTIILVDDVSNSGKTMFYAFHVFHSSRPRSVQTLVLVERMHKSFPVQIDYVGANISTAENEYVSVTMDENSVLHASIEQGGRL